MEKPAVVEKADISEKPIVNSNATTAPKPERKRKSAGGLSITSFLTKKEEEAEADVTAKKTDYPKNPFTEEQLKKTWLIYADKIKLQGRMNFYTTLSKAEIEIEGNNIVLPIDNATQEIDIQNEKTEILSFIRKKLQNYTITLESRIMEDNNPQKKLYTTTDKFNFMAEKNPNLLILKDRLNLEIDI